MNMQQMSNMNWGGACGLAAVSAQTSAENNADMQRFWSMQRQIQLLSAAGLSDGTVDISNAPDPLLLLLTEIK